MPKVTDSFIFRLFQFLNTNEVLTTDTFLTQSYAFFIKNGSAMDPCHVNLLIIFIQVISVLRLNIDACIEY